MLLQRSAIPLAQPILLACCDHLLQAGAQGLRATAKGASLDQPVELGGKLVGKLDCHLYGHAESITRRQTHRCRGLAGSCSYGQDPALAGRRAPAPPPSRSVELQAEDPSRRSAATRDQLQVSVVRPRERLDVQATVPIAVEDCPAVLLTFSVTV